MTKPKYAELLVSLSKSFDDDYFDMTLTPEERSEVCAVYGKVYASLAVMTVMTMYQKEPDDDSIAVIDKIMDLLQGFANQCRDQLLKRLEDESTSESTQGPLVE